MNVRYIRYTTEESDTARRYTTVTFELDDGVFLIAKVPDVIRPDETTAEARDRVREEAMRHFASMAHGGTRATVEKEEVA